MLLYILCKLGFHKYKVTHSINVKDLVRNYMNYNLYYNYKLNLYKNEDIMIKDYKCIRCGKKKNNIAKFKKFLIE